MSISKRSTEAGRRVRVRSARVSETARDPKRCPTHPGKLLGNSPAVWLNMQAAHDLWHARLKVDTSKIPTLKEPKPARAG